jgi:hypothetical protein
MRGPVWLTGIFAALMLTVAVYCAGRLAAARWWHRPTELDTDGAHVVMGVAMAGMLVTGLHTLPTGLWEAVFAVGALWFGTGLIQTRRHPATASPTTISPATASPVTISATTAGPATASPAAPMSPWRCLHPAPHLVECVAMLYMLLALPTTIAVKSTMGAMPGSRFSFLALGLALFMFAYVAWVSDRTPALARAAQSGCASTPPGRTYLAPRCAALCKIAMGTTMGYMLILML